MDYGSENAHEDKTENSQIRTKIKKDPETGLPDFK
jgi:hypothetical protein